MEQTAPTIHNSAKCGEIAKTVLMPGDPLRAKFIAESYLGDAKMVSSVRNTYAYTGDHNGKTISVMASGMGASSMGIYSHELFAFYGVEKIIRVGSAGGIHPDLRLRDIVIATGSHTDTGYARQFDMPGTIAPVASFELAYAAYEYAGKHQLSAVMGTVFSGEAFYYEDEMLSRWLKMGALAVEMESAALYMNAARLGKQALALCTISDLVFTGERCSAQERQDSFHEMIEMALAIA